ncbi:MAG: nucleoside monophosphate kinase [Candidatus Paceibacterota bacterium]|jgi:adenylate kinase
MIVFFGPPGAGKSVQGQLLAAKYGWRWLGIGQLLRDTHELELIKKMQAGDMVDLVKVNKLVEKALMEAGRITHIVIDGFPRQLAQAQWLIELQSRLQRKINLVIVLEVSDTELLERLRLRGRVDDTSEAIQERLNLYNQEVTPVLDYFIEQNIKIAHINGEGTIDQIHQRILEEIEKCKLA